MATGTETRAGTWKTDGQTITLPWTAPSDGFVYAEINPNTSSIAYYYIYVDTTTSWAFLAARDGIRSQQLFPVRKGKVYSLNANSNVKSVNLRFFSLS